MLKSKRIAIALTYLLGCLAITAPQVTLADTVIPTFDAVYTLTSGPLTIGETTRRLYRDGDNRYVYESHSKPTGYAKLFTKSELYEKTTWTFTNGRPRPLSYSYQRTGSEKRRRNVNLEFNWEKGRVTNIINDDPWTMAVPDDVQDKLLYHLTLMHDLQNGRQITSYPIADGGKVKTYEFEFLGEETVSTKLGKYKTIKLKQPGRKHHTLVWCAPDLHYLPIQLEHKSKDGTVKMKITGLKGIAHR